MSTSDVSTHTPNNNSVQTATSPLTAPIEQHTPMMQRHFPL
ncbi:hypothetical protein [Comamonas aquatica]|nr:hypothetical protein [Comamonas aquatica]